MEIKSIAKKVAGVLPIGSLLKHIASDQYKRDSSSAKDFMKELGHFTYAVLIPTYIFVGIMTGAWTPQQYKQYNEQARIEKVQKVENRDKLFGEKGYIDKDGDGVNSPSPEGLEKAVKSYEEEI